MFKVTSIMLAVLVCGSTFTACRSGRDDNGVVINEGKVQLLVGNFKGGYGRAWLDKAVSRFEEKYENFDFGNGKVGVQVIVDDHTRYAGAIETRMSGYPQHVILGEAFNYYNMVDIRENSSKYLADMSDVVTTPINYDLITGQTDTSLGEGATTIKDIMNSSMEEYLNVAASGKYYAIPFYEATVGFTYDVDVFEKYGFYYAAEGYGEGGGFVQNTSGQWIGENGKVLGASDSMTFEQAKAAGMKLSKGPDGKEGTYDDGMPATYDEFFALCQRMSDRDVIPLTWPGSPEIQRYLNYLAYNLWTDYEGKEQMGLNFSLNGRATDLIDMSSYDSATGKYKTYEADITNATGYLLQQQAGKFEAINFIYRLLGNSAYYDSSTCLSDISQTETERRFLLAALPEQKDRAMLVDGSWWLNEARNIFNDMAVDYGEQYSAQNRRFGWLALPKANAEKVGEESTVAFLTSALIFINQYTTSDPVTLKVAKQFVKFLETRESLSEFNQVTSSARPYDYELTESEIKNLTYVGEQNYNRHKTVETIFTYSQNPIVRKYPEYFSSSGYTVFQSNDGLYEILSQAFINNKNITGWDYFKSMVNDHGEAFWTSKFGNDIGG